MNYMPREMRTQSRELRTEYRVDASGLLFVECHEPRASLTFRVESGSLQEDITEGLLGLFRALGDEISDIKFIGFGENEFIWLVSSPAYERVLQVA